MSEQYRIRKADDDDVLFIEELRRRNYMQNAPIIRIAGMTREEVIDEMDAWTERSLGPIEGSESLRVRIVETADGESVGYIMFLWPAQDDFSQLPQGFIYDIGVTREQRGTGAAALLIRHAEAYIREQGGAFVQLNVNAQNGRAVEFYRKQGYLEEWKVMGKCLIDMEP